MEISEIILLAGGFSLGFGLGLMVYAVHRLRETRYLRYRRRADKKYETLLNRVNSEEDKMRATVQKFTDLKEKYNNVA